MPVQPGLRGARSKTLNTGFLIMWLICLSSRFTPDTLLDTTSEKGIDLGLVIDLTFTSRYYHFSRFTSKGVMYEKIFVPGHVIPDSDIVDRWESVV